MMSGSTNVAAHSEAGELSTYREAHVLCQIVSHFFNFAQSFRSALAESFIHDALADMVEVTIVSKGFTVAEGLAGEGLRI